MCGRFTLTCSPDTVTQQFSLVSLGDIANFKPRYNIAPTQDLFTVRVSGEASDQVWQSCGMRWGLIPGWAKDTALSSRLINARIETVGEKPAFRRAVSQRRCLIPADGFYEWKTQGTRKQPYYFQLENHQLFAFAGLWETWLSPAKQEIISCTILTTAANPAIQPYHSRMPVVVPARLYTDWLDPQLTDAQALIPQLMEPIEQPGFIPYAVNTAVNRPTYDQPDCIQTIEPTASLSE
ncbi:MAG: SOS response-associated peptidase [Oscillatoriales cyanobacterium RM2_1_1]|nr:SOS response-associated peptidase [Oscillatoriales cyanobacterium SM2_3_0]NJO46509.1 SOS response-associated peptidase [Oscillatoriales cyanobacterium RM2_1_1]